MSNSYYLKTILFSIFSITFFIPQITLANSKYSSSEIVDLIQETSNQLDQKPKKLTNKLANIQNQCKPFSEEELILLIDEALDIFSQNNVDQSDQSKLKKARSFLINKLTNYKVTGFSFAIDPNLACILERQNPEFKVTFKNHLGGIKEKFYRASFYTLGFKLEAALKFDLIFFVNTDVDFYNSSKPISFGLGLDVNCAFGTGIGFTILPLKGRRGSIIIVSFPIFFAFPSLSMVLGGSLYPI